MQLLRVLIFEPPSQLAKHPRGGRAWGQGCVSELFFLLAGVPFVWSGEHVQYIHVYSWGKGKEWSEKEQQLSRSLDDMLRSKNEDGQSDKITSEVEWPELASTCEESQSCHYVQYIQYEQSL